MIPRRARAADVFGEFPAAQRGVQLPEESRVKNVLEIYLYGGLSPWETFYFVDSYGRANNTFYYAFDDLPDGQDSNALALSMCGVDDSAAQPSFFASDELGNDVQLGPYAFALRERPDMIDRLRLVTMQHDLLPHEAAVPFAVSGKRVGQPTLAGLGGHIQRFFSEREGQRRSPFAYVLSNAAAIPSDNIAALFAVGTHPGSARPLSINVDAVEELGILLERDGVGPLAKHDTLVEAYINRFRNRLRHQGRNGPLRAKRLQELEAAARATKNAAAVKDLLAPTLSPLPTLDLCGSGETTNVPARSLEMAAHLLTHSTEAARYVCVLDTGLIGADGGGGYDTHAVQCVPTARNFTNIIRGLAAVTNAPGERDAKKIDLDDTLVLLTTEFGRTPYVQEGVGGRNHHPAGYVTALLGGPIRESGIIGAIDDTGTATSASTPAESRMAALLALGIFPFSGDSYFLSDVPGETEELEAVKRVTRTFLGVDL
jgi:hypothetical protein